MTSHEELAALKQRLSAAEYELGQLRLKIAGVEARLTPSQPSAPPVTAPVLAPALIVTVQPSRSVPDGPPAAPPVLPPVLRSPPAPVLAPEAQVESTWTRLRAALQQFQLWPPSGESNAEVRLGAWWATRMGALLAVIGVVFFGVYISLATPPWVKLAELLAVVGGVGALGLWLERRVPKFGAVVFGGALALLYFSAYAAYAVPATRVLDQVWQGVAAQLVAVGAVFAAAQWRRSVSVATMAVALGFVAAWFSFASGLAGLALSMALVLAAGAVALRLVHGWVAPVAVALPLAYAVFARFALVAWSHKAGDAVQVAWLWLLGFGAVFFWSDWWAGRGAREPLAGRGRGLQSINASLAVALGLVVTLRLDEGSLPVFYAGAAVLCGLGAWAWRGREGSAALVALLACKAAGLLGLAVIAEFLGHVRALVLLTQAFALLVAARSAAIKALRVAAAVVWGSALLFFLGQAVGDSGRWDLAAVAAAVGLVGGAAWWLGLCERWLGASRNLCLTGGMALGAVAGGVTNFLSNASWSPALGVLLGAAAASGGAISRGWTGPASAAAVALVGAHAGMVSYGFFGHPAWLLWTNEGVLLVAVLVIAVVLDRRGAEGEVDAAWRWALARAGLVTVALLALQVTWFAGLSRPQALAAAMGTAAGLMVAAKWARRWPLVGLSTLALGLGWLGYGPSTWGAVTSGHGWLALAALAAWVPAALFAASAARRERMLDPVWRELTPAVQTLLATLVTLFAMQGGLVGLERVVASAVVGLGVAALAWRPGVLAALPAASALMGVGILWAAGFGRDASQAEIGAATLLSVATATVPVLARRWIGPGAGAWRRWAAWAHPASAWLLLAVIFLRQSGGLAPYATVLCGGAAIALFLLGLFARERAVRLVGLGGLAMCVPRVFLVDIDSTVYRIGAFVALGVVLLWVGFSYHRFRHLITGERPGAAKTPDEKL